MTQEQLGKAMLELARSEGHRRRMPPSRGVYGRGRPVLSNTRTAALVRLLREADGWLSTAELATQAGVTMRLASRIASDSGAEKRRLPGPAGMAEWRLA